MYDDMTGALVWPPPPQRPTLLKACSMTYSSRSSRQSTLAAATKAVLAGALALGVLAGCVGAEGKVRRGLVNAGLSESMAGCMARPMVKELSTSQLMKLNSLSRARGMDLRETTLEEFMRRTRALQDPDILQVTMRAATGCFIQGA